ncbi:hypothetical protein ACDI96_16805 [Citrobacter telavivensis]
MKRGHNLIDFTSDTGSVPSETFAPKAANSASIFRHSSAAGVGSEKICCNVFWCLALSDVISMPFPCEYNARQDNLMISFFDSTSR